MNASSTDGLYTLVGVPSPCPFDFLRSRFVRHLFDVAIAVCAANVGTHHDGLVAENRQFTSA